MFASKLFYFAPCLTAHFPHPFWFFSTWKASGSCANGIADLKGQGEKSIITLPVDRNCTISTCKLNASCLTISPQQSYHTGLILPLWLTLFKSILRWTGDHGNLEFSLKKWISATIQCVTIPNWTRLQHNRHSFQLKKKGRSYLVIQLGQYYWNKCLSL